MVVLRQAVDPTEVLLVHAPYPGRLKFQGVPSSLFAAISPFVLSNPDRTVSYCDPRGPSVEFYSHLTEMLSSGKVRALCISTSTAAIGETARIAGIASAVTPDTLVVVGGPHEDAVQNKVAQRVPGVHVSVGGEAEDALRWILEQFLSADATPDRFLASIRPASFRSDGLTGRLTLSCRSWSRHEECDFGPSRHRDPRPRVFPDRYPVFGVFKAPETIPLMVSRGCSYGRCTFCAESIRGGGVVRTRDYRWVEELAARNPEAALYFQDSIFPAGNGSSMELLPLLAGLGREWGCQVYLPTLTRSRIAELAAHGCTYLYTGVESASEQVLEGIQKPGLNRSIVLERATWAAKDGVKLGISLMFGAMSVKGDLLETRYSVQETKALTWQILETGVELAGFYPNVQTVLPGTALAKGLVSAGFTLDFYRMPRAEIFDGLEDGGVGYNFLTVADPTAEHLAIAEEIARVGAELQQLAGRPW